MQLGYHRIRLKLAKLTQPLAFMKSWGAMATNQTVNPLNLLQEKRLIMLKKFDPGNRKKFAHHQAREWIVMIEKKLISERSSRITLVVNGVASGR